MFSKQRRGYKDEQKSSVQPTDIVNLTQKEIEDCLLGLLKHPTRERRQIQKLVPERNLEKFLIFATELFRKSPTLLEVGLEQRCLVIGDLHSSFNDLLCVLYYGDLPPEVNYIFLGDYTGRGQYRLETLIAVMLLKLRWPDHVFMLRGRNESGEENPNNQFYNAVMDAYNNIKIFYLFAQMFDYMPLAAIVNDAVFCCHGGVSQWLSSRNVLKNIQRPISLQNLSQLEACVVTDLLWADPAPNQKQEFLASTRGTSYTFNSTGLRAVLHALECSHLIRSNCEVAEGIREDFRNKCFTIYSAHGISEGKPRGIFLGLDLDANGNVEIDRSRDVMEVRPSACQPQDWGHHVTNFLEQSFKENPCNYLKEISGEKVFNHYNITRTFGDQIVTHTYITNWMLDYGMDLLNKVKERCNEHVPPNTRYFPRYFPLIFDMLYGSGGTFRTGLNAFDAAFIKQTEPPIPVDKWPDKSWSAELLKENGKVEERHKKLQQHFGTQG